MRGSPRSVSAINEPLSELITPKGKIERSPRTPNGQATTFAYRFDGSISRRSRKSSLADQRVEILRAGAQPDTGKEFSALPVAFSPRGECESQVRAYLQEQQIPKEDIEEIVSLLREYPSPRLLISTNPASPGTVRVKTDPLKRSADLLGDAVEDKVDEITGP